MSTKDKDPLEDIDYAKLNELSTTGGTNDEYLHPEEETEETEETTEEEVEEQAEEGNIPETVLDSTEESGIEFFISDFQTKTGLEFSDEELEVAAGLGEDIESLSELALLAGRKIANAELEGFYAKNPDLYEALLYKQANSSLSGFGKEVGSPDYSTLDLDEVDNQKLIYTEYRRLKGDTDEEIAEAIELAETKNILQKKAEDAKEVVTKHFAKAEETRKKNLEITIAKEREEEQAIVKQVFDIIDTGKIMGVQLSKKEQQEFKDFLAKPVDKDANTAKSLAYDKLTIEQELLIDMFVKNGFKNIAAIEKPTVDKLKKLKENLKNRIPPVGDTKKGQDLKQGTGADEFDFKAMEEMLKK